MATRRIISSTNDPLDIDASGTPHAPGPSNIAPAVPSSVLFKLLSFTFAMVTLPIGTYFFITNYVLVGNNTVAGALAAVMANVVLIAYVVMAYQDDQAEQEEAAEKEKKAI
ncbi:vacuolar ATPase assembly integral membrane protein vma21 [Paraphaeosphaeria sporulosa]|uniref:Vacuolar ATPase assembly integral membrane protein VMA21 n=1 Tax=Paraphaeosphaeria sporulosa TaxID=1460663 RepID=A0A177CP51_9PLEO|nr:vacuolar ATPase assembly integral membrane protein VMA21 [Paraphaeosphaeria sporulosa]OAG08752.1 vacuolar ATPase assembly integral membrane protein VMA21 [Paraphaeosphaeria sporulosa]